MKPIVFIVLGLVAAIAAVYFIFKPKTPVVAPPASGIDVSVGMADFGFDE